MLVKSSRHQRIRDCKDNMHELTNMKVLISIALLGVILSELCNAQAVTCTPEEIENLGVTFATCDPTCLATVCDCCTQALDAGSSDSNYDCCSAYSGLLQCSPDTTGVVPCATLPGDNNGDGPTNGDRPNSTASSGVSSVTAACVISAGLMTLASSVVNQLIL